MREITKPAIDHRKEAHGYPAWPTSCSYFAECPMLNAMLKLPTSIPRIFWSIISTHLLLETTSTEYFEGILCSDRTFTWFRACILDLWWFKQDKVQVKTSRSDCYWCSIPLATNKSIQNLLANSLFLYFEKTAGYVQYISHNTNESWYFFQKRNKLWCQNNTRTNGWKIGRPRPNTAKCFSRQFQTSFYSVLFAL